MSGVWDNDEEGAFDEEGTLFDGKRMDDSIDEGAAPPAEAGAEAQPATKALAPSRERAALVATFDAQSRPMVARHVMRGGRPVQIEPWHPPTADEQRKLMEHGKLVRGGVVSASTNQAATMQMAPLGEVEQPAWKKYAKIGVGVAGAAALVYGGYRVYKTVKEVS